MPELSNQLAIISGAMGDIGRSIALELARRGADIALGDVREPNDTVDFQKSIRDLGVPVWRSQYLRRVPLLPSLRGLETAVVAAAAQAHG